MNREVSADIGFGPGEGAVDIVGLNNKKRTYAAKDWNAELVKQAQKRGIELRKQDISILSANLDALSEEQQDLYLRWIMRMKGEANIEVADLLGDMIQQVPFRTMDEIRDAGFLSPIARRGDKDDIFVLKALSGFKQEGLDTRTREFWRGNQPKERKDIEQAIINFRAKTYDSDSRRRDRFRETRGKDSTGDDKELKQMITDTLTNKKPFNIPRDEIQEFFDSRAYNPKQDAEQNIVNFFRNKKG
jgi:hypothetical protein